MSDEYTPTLQEIATNREWWLQAGAHYREVAHWLRGVAARCRLPNPQRELLTLGRRYERRAERFDRGWLERPMIGETSEWAWWAMTGLFALVMLLPWLKR